MCSAKLLLYAVIMYLCVFGVLYIHIRYTLYNLANQAHNYVTSREFIPESTLVDMMSQKNAEQYDVADTIIFEKNKLQERLRKHNKMTPTQ